MRQVLSPRLLVIQQQLAEKAKRDSLAPIEISYAELKSLIKGKQTFKLATNSRADDKEVLSIVTELHSCFSSTKITLNPTGYLSVYATEDRGRYDLVITEYELFSFSDNYNRQYTLI
jgi:hypothetical protein